MRRPGILLLLLVLSQLGCIEKYNPVLDAHTGAIVVEGLITNLKEAYNVKISTAVSYDSLAGNTGIKGAIVSIKDNLGNTFFLHEDYHPGNYYSDTSEFTAMPGRSYSLAIKMPNGDSYESTPQLLTTPPVIDSIYGNITNKNYLFTNELGELTTKMAYGSETFLDLSYQSDSILQFRFENTLMKCFSYWYWYTPEMKAAYVPFPPPNPCTSVACPYVVYNWNKFSLNANLNLTSKTHDFTTKQLKNNSVCFFPFDNSFYPILIKKDSCGHDLAGNLQCMTIKGPSTIEGILLEMRMYALNQSASVFYNQASNQLSSQGELFDPIAVQIQGNMKCLNNPNKLVLGLFEVSSCTTRSYWLIFNYIGGSTIYQPIADITYLQNYGSGKEEPGFWQKIFH